MDIILTPNGEPQVRLSQLPEKVKYGGQGKFMTYSIISLGDVKVPRGSSLDTISWSATFPGETRLNEPYVKSDCWEAPEDLVEKFRDWRDNGTTVNVLITDTSVNLDCYVEKFEGKFTGGHGDFDYDVTFVEAIEITITTKKKKKNKKKKRKASKKKKKATSKAKPKTQIYVVKQGDTPWRVAQAALGSGARYDEVVSGNKAQIPTALTGLHVGASLTIPSS